MTWCCLWRDVNSSLAWLWTVRRDGRKLLAYYLYMTGLRGNTSFSFFLAFSDLQLCSWHISETATRPAGGRTWTPAILVGWLHPLQMRTHGSHRWRRVTSASPGGRSGFRVSPCVVCEKPSGCWGIDNSKLREGTCKGIVFSRTRSERRRVLFRCIATCN